MQKLSSRRRPAASPPPPRESNAPLAAALPQLTGGGAPTLGGGADPDKKTAKRMGMAMDEEDEDMFAVRCWHHPSVDRLTRANRRWPAPSNRRPPEFHCAAPHIHLHL